MFYLDPPPRPGDLLIAVIPSGQPMPDGWEVRDECTRLCTRVSDGTETHFEFRVWRVPSEMIPEGGKNDG